MEAASASIWGTWDELVLGAAVLRHGTAAWDDVAGELRSRTHFPALYTHQEVNPAARAATFFGFFASCHFAFDAAISSTHASTDTDGRLISFYGSRPYFHANALSSEPHEVSPAHEEH